MRRSSWLPVALAAMVASAIPAAATAAQAPPDSLWARLARRDLQAIHDTLLANHPGPVDTVNTGFADWLERGLHRASRMADSAAGPADALTALRYYVAGFADGHTTVSFWWEPSYLRWPGFVAALTGDRFVVREPADSWSAALPPEGAELLACDGTPVAELVRDSVLPYRDIDVDLEAYLARSAPYLFVHDGSRWLPRPDSCRVRTGDGDRTYHLAWGWARGADIQERIAAARQVAGGDSIGVTEPTPGEFWVRLPTFYPTGAAEARMKEVIERMPTLRDARRVVFDVRGNGGGTSQWGEDLVEGLYGAGLKRWSECRRGADGFALWRVSPGNLSYLESFAPVLEERFGTGSDVFRSFSRLVGDMAAALEDGHALVRQPDPDADEEPDCPTARPPIPAATVVLLTDGACASACLDFADVLLAMPGVIHAGRQTAADAVYMDVRSVSLPSGLGGFSIAQKVYRGRVRGHNQPYTPSHRFHGDISDTAALQAWIRGLPDPR